MRRKGGFTIVELMVVTVVLSTIMAIAIPSLLSTRKSANEAGAIGALKTIITANTMYRSRLSGYADGLAELQARGYVDSVLGAGQRSGYNFSYVKDGTDAWHCSASPITPGSSGDSYFFADESGVIRVEADKVATAASPPSH